MVSQAIAGELMVLLFLPAAVLPEVDQAQAPPEQSRLPSMLLLQRSGEVIIDCCNISLSPSLTQLTENIYLTGSVDALQNWSPTNAMILDPANYPTWSSTSIHICYSIPCH